MFIVVGKSFVIKNMNKALIIGCGKIAGNGNMDELETHGGHEPNPNISVKAVLIKILIRQLPLQKNFLVMLTMI